MARSPAGAYHVAVMRNDPPSSRARVRRLLLQIVLAVATPAAGAVAAEAQVAPIMFEARAGGGFPVENFSGPDAGWVGAAGRGVSFGMNFNYSFRWYAGVYLGFSQHRFRCPVDGCGRRTDLVSTGFDGGTRFVLGTGGVVPWIRTGLLSYRVEGAAPATDGGSEAVTSERAYGVEAGLGLTIQLRPDVVIAPGIRYGRISPRFEDTGRLPMRYLILDAGLVFGF